MSIEEIEEYRNAPPETSKWYPEDWGYSDGKNSAFDKILMLWNGGRKPQLVKCF